MVIHTLLIPVKLPVKHRESGGIMRFSQGIILGGTPARSYICSMLRKIGSAHKSGPEGAGTPKLRA